MAPVPGKAFLDRVIARVHTAGQGCASQESYQLHSITLRLLSLLKQGREATLDNATYEAFGCAFAKWRERNLERQSRLAWELADTLPEIPDYDPTAAHVGKLTPIGRAVFEMPEPGNARRAVQAPLVEKHSGQPRVQKKNA